MKVIFQGPRWSLFIETALSKDLKAITSFFIDQGLSANDAQKLCGLVLELSVDSETPLIKLFEGQPTLLNIDKLARKRYLFSGSIQAFRSFYLEYKEQKVAKALLHFLCHQYPSFFKDLWPKHGLIPPLGISFQVIGPEEIKGLDLALRLRHHYVVTNFVLPEHEALKLFLKHRLEPVFISPCYQEELPIIQPVNEQKPEIEDVIQHYVDFLKALPSEWAQGLIPRALAVKGFLFAPLLSYMDIFTKNLSIEKHPLRQTIKELFILFRQAFPEPFGLLPE